MQDKQKNYVDKNIVYREFKVGDHVYLKMKSRKSSLKLGICAKLAPRYCGPLEILDMIGLVSYRLELPSNIITHDVFHVYTYNILTI
jgi:hypothetical protein